MKVVPLDTELETERCILRLPREEDNMCVWTASRVKGFTDGMLWDPPETMEEIEENRLKTIERWESGEDIAFSAIDKESHECIARIAIRRRDEQTWNIGYWVHPEHQGKGYATEIVARIVQFGFEQLHAKRITSEHASWNEASGKVLTKVGFTHIGHNPCGFTKHGVIVPEEEYEIKS